MNKPGYIYILTNDYFKDNLLKIGMTARTPEARARELYEKITGVPGRFTVAYKKRVANCEAAETQTHWRLSQHRTNKYREFFELPLEQAIQVVDSVAKIFPYDEKVASTQPQPGSRPTIHKEAEPEDDPPEEVTAFWQNVQKQTEQRKKKQATIAWAAAIALLLFFLALI